MKENEGMHAQIRKGLIEFCVLLAIKKKTKVYTSDILEMLKKSDMIVVEGTLYPLLSRLKTQKLVDYDWEESRTGPPRKYYTLTGKGEEQLVLFKKTWNSLINSIESLF